MDDPAASSQSLLAETVHWGELEEFRKVWDPQVFTLTFDPAKVGRKLTYADGVVEAQKQMVREFTEAYKSAREMDEDWEQLQKADQAFTSQQSAVTSQQSSSSSSSSSSTRKAQDLEQHKDDRDAKKLKCITEDLEAQTLKYLQQLDAENMQSGQGKQSGQQKSSKA